MNGILLNVVDENLEAEVNHEMAPVAYAKTGIDDDQGFSSEHALSGSRINDLRLTALGIRMITSVKNETA